MCGARMYDSANLRRTKRKPTLSIPARTIGCPNGPALPGHTGMDGHRPHGHAICMGGEWENTVVVYNR
eukprot:1369887-Pyramimonas_sp.AAC.3